MKKNTAKLVISVTVGAIGGYAVFYYFFIELISLFFTGGILTTAISVLCLLLCILGLSALIYLLLTRRIKKQVLWLLVAAYICVVLIVLFGRHAIGRVFIWNPIRGITALSDWEMVLQSTLNFVLFIPVGYFFRKLNVCKTAVIGLILSIALELMQVVTVRGMFDTFDILLYVLGMVLGSILFRKWEFEVI